MNNVATAWLALCTFALGVAIGIYAGQDTCAKPAPQQTSARVHKMT